MSAANPGLGPREAAESLALWRATIDRALPRLREQGAPRLDPGSATTVVYIADQPHAGAEFALRQCLARLGGTVGLQVFHRRGSRDRLIEQVATWPGAVGVAVDSKSATRLDRDALLRHRTFWENIRGERLLFIDHDTMVRQDSLDPFADCDFIAPPWGEEAVSPWCAFGSGALSIRRRSAMLEICRTCNPNAGVVPSESVFFSVVTRLEAARYRIADDSLAARFGVESVYHPDPFALHKAWRYIEARRLGPLLEAVERPVG